MKGSEICEMSPVVTEINFKTFHIHLESTYPDTANPV